MAFELIRSGTLTVAATTIQAGTTFSDAICTSGRGFMGQRIVCALNWSGLVGMDAGSTVTVRNYGIMTEDESPAFAAYSVLMGVAYGTANGVDFQVTIGANAAGSKPFLLTGTQASTAIPIEPWTPFVKLRFVKGGTGTFTAGTFTIPYYVYGDTR